MSDKPDHDKHLNQALDTLDQLGETLDAMSGVVDRLRQHLQSRVPGEDRLLHDGEDLDDLTIHEPQRSHRARQEPFVVEISPQELEDGVDPVVH